MNSDKTKSASEIMREDLMSIPEEMQCVMCGTLDANKHQLRKFASSSYRCEECSEKAFKEEEEKRKKEQKEKEEKMKADRIRSFFRIIPSRYSSISEADDTEEEEIMASCTIFYGGFGTGKTWKAYKIAYDMYKNMEIDDFSHVTEIGLINEIKAGFVNNTFETRVKSFKEVDLLIVDEMGKNNDSDFNKAQIFEILNYRYDWEKKTILICNCEEKNELYDILSPAILDRFRERIVKMDGQSKRYS